jgi:hypothetical protein
MTCRLTDSDKEGETMKIFAGFIAICLLLSSAPGDVFASQAAEEAAVSSDTIDHDPRYPKRRVYRARTKSRRYPPRHRYVPSRRPRRSWADPRASVYIGAGVVGDFIWQTQNDLTSVMQSGGGLDIFFGFRFNRYFALELAYVGTFHSTSGEVAADYDRGMLHGGTLDGKIFLLPSSSRIEPFVQVGGGVYSFVEEGFTMNRELTGGGFHLGGGLDIRLNQTIGIGLRVLYKGIFVDNGTDYYFATEQAYINQITAGANLQIHF